MAERPSLTFRIEHGLKEESLEVLKKLGISMGSALNIFLKKVVKEKKIPFELSLED